jgi:hypothetical protein
MIAGKHLSRRTVLRGIGVSMALPLLDAMKPAFAASKAPPCRMLINYVPNGIVMKDFTPNVGPLGADLPRTLQPMAPFRNQVLVLSGMEQHWGNSNGDGSGDHARAAASYLTRRACQTHRWGRSPGGNFGGPSGGAGDRERDPASLPGTYLRRRPYGRSLRSAI